jgi:hypothetical protein
MSFEQTLRDRLHQEAGALPLPDREPERAAGRARSLRNHRRTVAAGLAVAVAAAVAVPRVVGDGGDTRPVSVGSPSESGLAPTGPLHLDWRRADGGVYQARSAFQDGGVVYALSTGPGVRAEDYPDGDEPRALYRLGDDGTWEPVALDGDRPRASDVSGTGGLLYAVSTGPASEGSDAVAHLSTSDDGGDTWHSEDVPRLDPPSTAVDWESYSSVGIESAGSTTLAIVTTRFSPPVDTLFPELAESDESTDYSVETRDEGLVLVRYPVASERPEDPEGSRVATPPSTAGADGAAGANGSASRQVQADGAGSASEGEDVRTVPWTELGVDGPDALATRFQLFTRSGDAWEPVTAQPDAFAGLDGIELASAGDRFVVVGWPDHDGGSTVLTSPDGVSWTPVAGAPQEQIVGVGPALVKIPAEGVTLSVSGDAGASWSEVDLAEVAGVDPGSLVVASDTGPLGLALTVTARNGEGSDQLVVSGDLADWTATPLADIVGFDDIGTVTPVVGEDRIVVTATHQVQDLSEPPASVTAIGTPVR